MQVNLVAAINASGYGITGFEVLQALAGAGHEVAFFPRLVDGPDPLDLGIDELVLVRQCLRLGRSYNVEAPCLRIASENDMTLFAGRGLRAALTVFETTDLSDHERRHLASLDLLLVSSDWGRQLAIGLGLPAERVHVAELGVDTDLFAPSELPTDGPTVFLNVAKWEARKGQDVLLEAFEGAFGPDDDVELRLLSVNQLRPGRDHEWQGRCRRSPLAHRIVALPRLPTRAGVAEAIGEAHCAVFPSRAEGWNLPLLEALACARPVIATDYSAHTQYLTPDNARLVAIDELEDASDPRWVTLYSERARGQWARLGPSQVEQLVDHLRAVHRERQAGTLRPNEAGLATARRLTWARTAERIARRLAG